MIPKIIHYCWLSNDPYPEEIQRCINSWKIYLSDYKFVKWDFNRFPKESSKWVSQAFDNRKYAFAADFIRLFAVYNYGGIYLDTDVEVIKSFDDFLNCQTMISWQDGNNGLEVAAFGAAKREQWLKDCLSYYDNKNFIRSDGSFEKKTLPNIVEDTLRECGYQLVDVNDINDVQTHHTNFIPVLPSDFFSPKSYKDGKIRLTSNTRCIHHFAGSWKSNTERYFAKVQDVFNKIGLRNTGIMDKICRLYDRFSKK